MYWALFNARGLTGLAIASDIGIVVQTAALTILLHRKRLVSLLHLEYAELGCLIQVTASSLTGFWGERPETVARWLLDRSAVHILATDAHDARRRVPILSAARNAAARIVGAEYAAALVEANPGAVVKGQPIPFCPRPVTG